MTNSNASDRPICCAAQRARGSIALRPRPLRSWAIARDEAGGGNRGVIVDVLPRTHNSPARHPGSGVDFLGPEHS